MPQIIEVPGQGQVEFPDGMSDAEIVKAIKKNSMSPMKAKPKSPSNPKSLPVNAGMANFAASVLGIPGDTAQNVVNLSRAVQGSIAGAVGATDWMPPLVENMPGSSEWIKQKMRESGIPGINPDNPNPNNPLAEKSYTFASRGGFIPGAALPAAGSMVAESIGGPQWAGVGALLPSAVKSSVNAATASSRAKQASLSKIKNETLSKGTELGFKLPPSERGGNWFARRLESIAGKAATAQEATVRNQDTVNAAVRKELGIPDNVAISESVLKNLRSQLSEPYREIAGLNKTAAKTLEQLKQARFNSNKYWRAFDTSGNPEAMNMAKRLDKQVSSLEKSLENQANMAGRRDLIDALKIARQKIAQTWDVERALNVGTGDVSAPILGKMVDKGKPLSGKLETIGKFQQAFPRYMREGEKMPAPGVSKSEALASALLGVGGYGVAGPYGTALAALPLISGPVRSALLSGPMQKGLPPYSVPNEQLLTQLAILQNSKKQ